MMEAYYNLGANTDSFRRGLESSLRQLAGLEFFAHRFTMLNQLIYETIWIHHNADCADGDVGRHGRDPA
ncbi:MAG: hypothetical protein RLY20_1861 [Verrucomicrobiota bacterium]|jgi:hypothetical protein